MIKKILFIFILSCFFALGVEGIATAQEEGGEDYTNANIHIKVEASTNSAEEIANGVATWHNFSGTEYSGGETITANPGDKVFVRTKLWNSSQVHEVDWEPDNVTGTSQTSNFEYVTSIVENKDIDGAGQDFTGYFFVGDGKGAVPFLGPAGAEYSECCEFGNGCEVLLTSVTLSDSFPQGQTIITAQATISNYNSGHDLHGGFLNNSSTAYAQEASRSSMVRIAVGEAGTTAITGNSTPTSTSNSTTTLPVVGNDAKDKKLLFISLAVIFIIAPALFIVRYYKIKKKL